MQLAHAVHHQLAGELVILRPQRRVLVVELVERGGDLLQHRLVLHLNRFVGHGLGVFDGRQEHRLILGTEGVADVRALELHGGNDVACSGLGEVVAGFADHGNDSWYLLGFILRGVVDRVARAHFARGHPEVGHLAQLGFAHDLEHARRQRSVSAYRQFGILAVGVLQLELAAAVRRRHQINDRVQQRIHSGDQRGPRGHHRRNLPGAHGLRQRRGELRIGQLLVGQIALKQRFVLLHNLLHQLEARRVHRVLHVRGDVSDLGLVALARVRLLREHIHHALERSSRPDRDGQHRRRAAELLLQRVHYFAELGVLLVHMVDGEHARQFQVAGLVPAADGLGLDARLRIDHNYRAVGDGERGDHLADKVQVTRRVHQRYLVVAVDERHHRAVDGVLLADFLRRIVREGVALLNLPQPGHHALREHERFREAGLAAAAVPHQGDVTLLANCNRCHIRSRIRVLPRMGVRTCDYSSGMQVRLSLKQLPAVRCQSTVREERERRTLLRW